MNDEIKDITLWKKYKKNNSEEARNQLIEKNLTLVKYQAGRINLIIPDFIEKEDLESFGMIGLIEAVENFKPEYGIEFKTYAQKRVRGAMLDYLRELDWLPSSLRREGKKIKNTVKKLSQELGRKPSMEELSAEIDISRKRIDNIYQKIYSSNWISLYGEVGDRKILDFLEGDNNRPEKLFNKKGALRVLTAAIKKLPEKEKLVITLYYYEELTQKEIASIMELSPARISQLHKKAVQRLRGFLSRRKEELLEV
ncbi:MAG: sigma-70 family RNA polymerase sigma factor [Bacillota bacterium]